MSIVFQQGLLIFFMNFTLNVYNPNDTINIHNYSITMYFFHKYCSYHTPKLESQESNKFPSGKYNLAWAFMDSRIKLCAVHNARHLQTIFA